MRTFIAVEAHTEELERLLGELSKIAGLKAVAPGGLHITLKFLGEIPEQRVEEVHSAMKRAFARSSSFSFTVQGVGAFPSVRAARVVWAGVKRGKEELVELHRRLEGELLRLGFSGEKRAFVPHITLARVKLPGARRAVARFIEAHAGDALGEVDVEAVTLMKSTLTPKGAIYTPLRRVALRTGSP
ncbi:MAG: RNA 2',3'-cyclic phosphodiesterase [Euryarchaeota archaeon]|nr:RNA 2',3'-cyclic phosphodiesterase [Euryarchaeota archaeon]